MASSSKTINMPLMFAISIGSTVALLATTMFGLAWYEYEKRVVLNEQVLTSPTHDPTYMKFREEQDAGLVGIEDAIKAIVEQNSPDSEPDEGQPEASGAPAE